MLGLIQTCDPRRTNDRFLKGKSAEWEVAKILVDFFRCEADIAHHQSLLRNIRKEQAGKPYAHRNVKAAFEKSIEKELAALSEREKRIASNRNPMGKME